LSYYRVEAEGVGWVPLGDELRVSVPGQGETALRLAVRRRAMAAFVPPAGATSRSGVLYASLLEVSDGEGARLPVPVSAEGVVTYSKATDGSLKADDPRVGLWVGYATIDYVSSPGQTGPEPDPPEGREHAANVPEGSEFEFRLIVHVDGELQARLVQHVTLLFAPGKYGPDPAGTGLQVVTVPGRSVLITDEALLSKYSGVALRDAQEVGRRISTAAYAFPRSGGTRPNALDLAGSFPAAPDVPGQLACSWTLSADDPLSPFLHRYHPDHQAPGPENSITRAVVLAFMGGAGSAEPAIPALGEGAAGVYRETITGLHREPLTVEGTFELHRVSSVDGLNR
jgi:hypothetical protein